VQYPNGAVGQVDGMHVPRYAGLTTFARLPRLEDVETYYYRAKSVGSGVAAAV
jgi:hypothetical protein